MEFAQEDDTSLLAAHSAHHDAVRAMELLRAHPSRASLRAVPLPDPPVPEVLPPAPRESSPLDFPEEEEEVLDWGAVARGSKSASKRPRTLTLNRNPDPPPSPRALFRVFPEAGDPDEAHVEEGTPVGVL
jgi:hypothetical protein